MHVILADGAFRPLSRATAAGARHLHFRENVAVGDQPYAPAQAVQTLANTVNRRNRRRTQEPQCYTHSQAGIPPKEQTSCPSSLRIRRQLKDLRILGTKFGTICLALSADFDERLRAIGFERLQTFV
jgi:hypothetical protein